MFTVVVVGAAVVPLIVNVSLNSALSPTQKFVAVWPVFSAQLLEPELSFVAAVVQVPPFAPDQTGLSPLTVRVMNPLPLPVLPTLAVWRVARPVMLPTVKSEFEPPKLP